MELLCHLKISQLHTRHKIILLLNNFESRVDFFFFFYEIFLD